MSRLPDISVAQLSGDRSGAQCIGRSLFSLVTGVNDFWMNVNYDLIIGFVTFGDYLHATLIPCNGPINVIGDSSVSHHALQIY